MRALSFYIVGHLPEARGDLMNLAAAIFIYLPLVGVVGSIVASRLPYFLIRQGHGTGKVIRYTTIVLAVLLVMVVAPAFLLLLGLSGLMLGYAGLGLLALIFLFQYLLPPFLVGRGLQRINEMDPQLGWVAKLAKSVASRSGYNKPFDVYLDPQPIPNAFAVGNSLKRMVVVTKGLLDLNPTDEELESVLAHEIGHLAHRDNSYALSTSLTPFLVYMIGVGIALAGYAMITAGTSVARTSDREESRGLGLSMMLGGLVGVLMGIAVTVSAFIINIPVLAFSRIREHLADIYSVDTLRSNALLSALRKIEEAITSMKTERESGKQIIGVRKMLYIVPALSGGIIGTIFSTHPSLAERALVVEARLRELSATGASAQG